MTNRSGVRQAALPLIMIGALAVSSLVAIRGALRMRDLEERTLRDFAAVAGANYAGRTYSMLGNFGPTIIVAAGKRGARTPEGDLNAIAATLDTLRTCCDINLPSRGVATGAWGDSASLRIHPRSVKDSARLAALHDVTRWPAVANAPIRFATGSTSDTTFMYLVYPQYDADRKPAGFIAVDLDLRVAADSMFGVLFRARPLLLPERMTGIDNNAGIGEVTLFDRGDRTLYRSPTPHPHDYNATVNFGRDTLLRIKYQLSPAAARGILHGSVPGAGAGMQIALAALAFALAVMIAITLRRAQNLARIRADFAASVTHELRTPLTQILMSAETLQLQRERSAEERTTFLNAIVGESRRLVHLIDNVLHFSRAERRILHVRPRAERVDTLVSQALANRTGFLYEAPSPVTASVDAEAFRLALANVLDNAVQHGASPIRVSVSPTGNGAQVVVEDSGPGIAAADRQRVLEPFVRLDAARERHPTGSGIGLAVAAEVMRAMNGTIALEDAEPGGLRVTLTLRAEP